ncbi:hypothetical protein [Pseudomonas sp. PLMAX]|uniref:hypothetical protein n=1 Tax=Pseudomonas sp. PLMAX TaxID=2201998 RepID=UPI0038BCAC3A
MKSMIALFASALLATSMPNQAHADDMSDAFLRSIRTDPLSASTVDSCADMSLANSRRKHLESIGQTAESRNIVKPYAIDMIDNSERSYPVAVLLESTAIACGRLVEIGAVELVPYIEKEAQAIQASQTKIAKANADLDKYLEDSLVENLLDYARTVELTIEQSEMCDRTVSSAPTFNLPMADKHFVKNFVEDFETTKKARAMVEARWILCKRHNNDDAAKVYAKLAVGIDKLMKAEGK